MIYTIAKAYQEGDADIISLLGGDFRDLESRLSTVKTASAQELSPQALKALLDINQALPFSEAREKQMKKLKDKNTSFVMTGQQPGLFLGPLLTLYKALAAVATARLLEVESGTPVVPVFWIQSEDHNIDEINHTHYINQQGKLDTWTSQEKAKQHVSNQYQFLGNDIAALTAEIRSQFERDTPSAQTTTPQTILSLLERHYSPHKNYPEAFSGLLSEVLSEEELLFFNPRHPGAETLAQKTLEQSLTNWQEIEEALRAQSERITYLGYSPQVPLREGSPLFFYRPESGEGPRYRLSWQKTHWTLIGDKQERIFHTEELLSILASDPSRFGTSALLRPIVQNRIFGTAAYIGGPAEISYLAQITPLYEIFETKPPLLFPRPSFQIIEPRAATWLTELKLKPQDFEKTSSNLEQHVAQLFSGEEESPEKLEQIVLTGIERSLGHFAEPTRKLDKTLSQALEKASEKISYQIHQFRIRYEKALARTNQVHLERAKRLEQIFFPGGKEQERVLSSIPFLCRYGFEFLRKITDNINPLEPEKKSIEL